MTAVVSFFEIIFTTLKWLGIIAAIFYLLELLYRLECKQQSNVRRGKQ